MAGIGAGASQKRIVNQAIYMSPFQNRKDEILQRLDFEAFYRREISQLGPRRGHQAQGLCPFHEDTAPSFSVNLENGVYKCFGCDAAGDIFSFIMRRRGFDFKEALAELGRQAGVDPDPGGGAPGTGYLSLRLKEFALAKRLPEDFLAQHGVKESRFPDGVLATDFHYLDAAGKLRAIRHRFANPGKLKFRWRRGDQVGFYGLWRLKEMTCSGWCLLVEGETDSLTCWLVGLPALGLPGKKTWRSCWRHLAAPEKEILQGLEVFFWEEPDAGLRNPRNPLELLPREEIARDLPRLRVLPAPREFKDLSEAHCQGREVKPLVAELKKKARPPEPPPVPGEGFSLSDLGNARRLVAQHGQDLRYSYLAKKWFHWTGQVWQIDRSGEVERRAKTVIADIYKEAADTDNFKQREALGKFALQSEDSKRIVAMVRQAQSEPVIPVLPQDFDRDPWLLNCLNGTVDLRTGELRPHDRADRLTCLASADYQPDAPCDTWERFIYMIQADNIEVYEFLQRALGYSLTGSCREQCLFMFWGSGANGKSTLVNLMTRLLGNYARNTPVETLLARNKMGEIPTDLARLDGPRFVTAKEVDRGRRLSESLVKELTGQDTITARFLYAEYFDFVPQFKLFLSTNNKPVIRGTDNAIWRRIHFVRFPLELAKKDQDEDLPEKLWAEAPGILAWLVRGCLTWQQGGLDPPAEVLEATAEYRAEMDVLQDFLKDCCLEAPEHSATAAELYGAYCNWADDQGIREKEQLKQRTFGMCLAERGFRKGKTGGGQRLWRGLGLRNG